MKEWFAIRTKANEELVAKVNYQRQAFTIYLPMMRVTRRHARRVEQVLRPVFPGYLFLHLAPEERNWVAIGSTRGAIGPVRFGETYIPVPPWVIDELRRREDEHGAIPWGKLEQHLLVPGQEVEVQMADGAAVTGILCSFRGEDNALVLLDFLQRQLEVQVPLFQISRK